MCMLRRSDKLQSQKKLQPVVYQGSRYQLICLLIVGLLISATGGKMQLTWSKMVAAIILTTVDTGFSSPMSAGTEFITAFMENIAYYYNNHHDAHTLTISALRRNTQVTVTVADSTYHWSFRMSAGETRDVILSNPANLALSKFNTSLKTVLVKSSLPVTVFSMSTSSASGDIAALQPVQNLGKEYRLTSPDKPIDRLYRFVVINNNVSNTVTVSQSSQQPLTITLQPYENVQFHCAKYPVSTQVTAQTPVAVLFGHPCLPIKLYCKCAMVFEQLTPISSWGTTFIVPSLALFNENIPTPLVVTSDGSDPEGILPSDFPAIEPTTSTAQKGSSLYIRTSIPVSISLLEPGALALIPEESFSTCYLVHTRSAVNTYILIVVKTAEKEGVRLGEQPLPADASWVEVAESDYSVALVSLMNQPMNRAIWHLTSKMGVYVIWRRSFYIVGSPALSLKVEPDGSKCRVHLDVELVPEEKNWADAQEHCWNLNSQLASFNSFSYMQAALKKLGDVQQSTAWVGLRRSLLSGEWRWLNRKPMEYRIWGSGEPNSSLIAQCAMMSLKPKENPTWSAMSCCNPVPFICFQPEGEIAFP